VFAEFGKFDPVADEKNDSDVSTTTQPMVSTEAQEVQNHIYQHELARGDRSCPYFAEDQALLISGWNMSRYPWHIVKYRSDRRSPIKGEVLHLGQKFETQGTTDIGHNQWDQSKKGICVVPLCSIVNGLV
jgi:hypothetical protein